jgi:hypothetical protein
MKPGRLSGYFAEVLLLDRGNQRAQLPGPGG